MQTWTQLLCVPQRFLPTVVCLACVSGGFALAQEQSSTDWAQWRGPSRDGHLPAEAAPWRQDLSNLTESWRVKLGPSYSGPIVSGDHVYITETIDKKLESVRAYNRQTGEELWSTAWEGAMQVPFFAAANGSWIRSTPATDDDRVYIAGMRDVLVCLNTQNGETIWKIDFVEQFETPLPDFGFVCSPLVQEDAVYVQAGASVFKLNKLTGEVIWQSMADGGGMFGSAFSSPMIAELHGTRQLIVQTRTNLAGLSLQDGKELWSQEIQAFRGMNILTPTVFQGGIFTSAYGGKSEFYRISQQDDATWKAELGWQNKTQGYMSSPVVIGDHAYLHLRNERATCINLASGEIAWTTKPFGKYWSMIANQDQILVLRAEGELLLLKANPEEFTVLDRKQVSEESTWAHLAVSGDQVFVRGLNELIVYTWKAAE
ncbi:MAG: PQQ-binding-like beta-propeller repeat protein [Pirellulales bacterium]|nr:PQQ-binding-like beta-propeller repeat protein [Pirellulales bacterium]